jgi:hypothetical protein
LRVLRSQYGHDAFLKETDRIDQLLAAELRGTRKPDAVPPTTHDFIGVSV